MPLIEIFLTATEDIWAQYHSHPFVKGIGDGTLEKEKFKYYILQDYLYLKDYIKVFALGIAKARSTETTALFASYIHLLMEGEMDIHKGYMGIFGISEEEIAITPRALDNVSYTSYMLRIAYEEGEAEILTAVLSCAYSYELIVKKLLADNPAAASHPFYGGWIQGYTADAYIKRNRNLFHTLDKLTESYTRQQIKHLVEIFSTCSRYELAFWDMAWEARR